MSRETRTIGSLLLLGAVLLSLNALAVSARPGEVAPAETTTATAAATAGTGVPVTDSTANGVLPLPPISPTASTAGPQAKAHEPVSWVDASVGSGVMAPGMSAEPISGVPLQVGIVNPNVDAFPEVPIVRGDPTFDPNAFVRPGPPITPVKPGALAPTPIPPHAIEPVHEGL